MSSEEIYNQTCEGEMWTCVESGSGGGAAPCSRAKHSATLLGGHLYVLGGRGAGGSLPLRDFWRYSLERGEWERLEQLGEPPPALQEHSATAHGDKLYVFGGEPGSSSSETPLWIYDTQLCVWRKLPGRVACGGGAGRRRSARACAVSPSARRGHSAHALDDCLLLYGGYMDLRGSTNELWAFHYESETWREVRALRAGPARHRHAAALLAGRLYVHGGQCDLRDCGDLWHYDILSRVWTCVRAGRGAAPGARSGHAGLRAGAHLYIFGGEARGHPTNEMWRFHFATESWERMNQGVKWPSARVDSRALLVGGACGGCGGGAGGAEAGAAESRAGVRARADPSGGFLREISKLSSFHLRRAARCSYSVLAAVDQDSTESLARSERPALAKSRSAYIIDERQPADGGESPRAGDLPDTRRADLAREPISVPDFADMILPTPVLSPVEATKLVYLDSEDEEDIKRDTSLNGHGREAKMETPKAKVISIPKSASVRFIKGARCAATASEDEAELSTSDYASAEKVNRPPGPSSLGFSNPHYLGPDVRKLGVAMTPDSGVGAGDIELQELGVRRGVGGGGRSGADGRDSQLHLLMVGGKESPHLALLQSPLSMWTYRLL